MLILAGKTCSGKSTIQNILIKEHGFKKIITYTTRPKRPKEKDGESYWFITKEEFKEKIDEGFFAEWKVYGSDSEWWYYGTSVKDLENSDDKTVIVLSPYGVKDVLECVEGNSAVAYIYANNKTIKQRLIKRGDNESEAKRRIKADNEDFKGFELVSDRIFYNNYDSNLDNIVNDILVWFDLMCINQSSHK